MILDFFHQTIPAGQHPGFHILEEGRNSWRIRSAERAAFLIDPDSYFKAFAEALLSARRSIFILGWDIDSRVELFRDGLKRPYPSRLGDFLNWVVSRRPDLHAYVLIWDYSMIYTLERELLPSFKLGWNSHRRMHFRLDGKHPMGASHHQKVVVVDDSIAFVGGIDLTKCRWDTSKHSYGDSRRNEPGCPESKPFHDIQMAVDGEAAEAMGELARARWFRATGKRIPFYPPNGDPWPSELLPNMRKVRIGISRTEPEYRKHATVREVEALYVDSINSAGKYIYIENQYLTSTTICELLSGRLTKSDCPEIVIVLPYKSSGWLEEGTMDALRSRVLEKLRSRDRYGRLRIYYPKLPGYDYPLLNVHAKLSIIDDRFVRVGSSNLSNRSMGFDSECDLAVEAREGDDSMDAIRAFRAELLGEHLGASADKVRKVMDENRSLIASIEALRGGARTLEELDGRKVQEIFDSYFYETSLLDPGCPAEPAELIDQFVPEEVKHSGVRPVIWGVATFILLLGLAAAWTWTPLRNWLNQDLLLYYTSYIAARKTAPLIVIGAFAAGGLMHFPLTLLIVATAVTFPPFQAFIYSMAGSLTSAAALYGLGWFFGRNAVRKFGGRRINQLSRKLAKGGIFTMVMIRIFPIGPFSFINFVAGASHIRLRDFLIGSAIGLLPGLVAITFLGGNLGTMLRHPRIAGFVLFAALVLLLIAVNILVRRWFERRRGRKQPGDEVEA